MLYIEILNQKGWENVVGLLKMSFKTSCNVMNIRKQIIKKIFDRFRCLIPKIDGINEKILEHVCFSFSNLCDVTYDVINHFLKSY